MSDFLFSSRLDYSAQLAETLERLTWVERSRAMCFQGPWGSLAVSENHHRGFQPYETAEAISVVIGGPLPKVPSVEGPGIDESNRGTATVAKRFFEDRTGDWHFDLLAPCCFLHVDKSTHAVTVVTDEMSFIPAYLAAERSGVREQQHLSVSTHPDAAALHVAENGELAIDPVSACDLMMNCIITYPHTLHENVRELAPASIHRIERPEIHSTTYWQPVENSQKHRRLREAAHEAREALLEVVQRAADYYGRLGLLLSAGEDSRTLACMVPRGTPLHCFAVAPTDNRELRIARQVALALGATFESVPLPAINYLRDVGRRALFTGSSCVSAYAHLMGLLDKTVVAQQPVVLGGYKGDVFLKGYYRRARNVLPGVPFQRFAPSARQTPSLDRYFPGELVAEVQARKERHRDWVRGYLPTSADCWCRQFPMSQGSPIAHYWSDRRMFASLEPFMTARIVDLAIGVQPEWLLNRRLYHAMAAPYLRRLWWIPHGEGHFPAFTWYMNFLIRPVLRTYWKLRYGRARRRQGAWPVLDDVLLSRPGACLAQEVLPRVEQLGAQFSQAPAILEDTALMPVQRYALLQLLSMLEQFDHYRQVVPAT